MYICSISHGLFHVYTPLRELLWATYLTRAILYCIRKDLRLATLKPRLFTTWGHSVAYSIGTGYLFIQCVFKKIVLLKANLLHQLELCIGIEPMILVLQTSALTNLANRAYLLLAPWWGVEPPRFHVYLLSRQSVTSRSQPRHIHLVGEDGFEPP